MVVKLSAALVQLVQILICGVQANGVCVIANKKKGLANHHDVKLYYVDIMVYVIFCLLYYEVNIGEEKGTHEEGL